MVCGGLPAFHRFHRPSSPILVVVCGGLRWFVVVCGGLRWFVIVCGGLSYSHTPVTCLFLPSCICMLTVLDNAH